MPRAEAAARPDAARLDAIFGALADETRRGIIERLAEGEATVGELAAPLSISMPAVSRHLKVLEAAGLVTRTRDRQFTRSQLRAEGVADALSWLERYRILWDARIDRLEAHLREEGDA